MGRLNESVESTPLPVNKYSSYAVNTMAPVVNVPIQPVSQQSTYAIYPNYPPNNNTTTYQTVQPVVYSPPPQVIPTLYPSQIIYVQTPGYPTPVVFSSHTKVGPWNGHATASLILFILSAAGVWLCSLPSISLSLHMVAKRVIPQRNRGAVIACSIIELIGFIFFPAFVWYGQEDCFNGYYNRYCTYLWYGWIAIVAWWSITIACGIPRTIYTFNARNNTPNSR